MNFPKKILELSGTKTIFRRKIKKKKKKTEEENAKNEDLPFASEITSSNSDFSEGSETAEEVSDCENIHEYTGMIDTSERIHVPLDFQPTLENKMWAIKAFPYKSPEQITKRIIKYFTDEAGKNVKKTPEDWQQQWRNFAETHKTIGANKYSFQDEHDAIRNELFNLILTYIADYNLYLVPYNEVINEFTKHQNFEENDIKEHLNIAELQKIIEPFFNYYYHLKIYNQDDEWAEEVDKAMLQYINSADKDDEESLISNICNFIRIELVVTEKQINLEFPNNENSVRNLLRVFTKSGTLSEKSGYFYPIFKNSSTNPTYQERREKTKLKLKALELNDEQESSENNESS